MKRYKFKGYTITNCGYHQPDHCVWWEACDDNGLACFHGKTIREVEFLILESKWQDKLRRKESEAAELRRRLKVAEDALRKLQERLVASVYNGTIDPHEALKIAEDAIAAISEEGGAK